MSIFKAILYSGGLVFIAVGTLHLTLGLNADVMLGATLPPAVIADPVLDSQNRFYGVSFALYGILLWLFARDMQRYAPVFYCLLAIFFVAGLARILSIALHGMPSLPIVALLGLELLLPPILLIWYRRVSND